MRVVIKALVCVIVIALHAQEDKQKAETAQQPALQFNDLSPALQAYIYGYPLVLLDATKKSMLKHNGINQFAHLREFPTPDFKEIVSPNADTLYSSAWLDLSREPVILKVPNTHGRYYVLELLDAWSNVFNSIGKRTTGTKKQEFLLAGPHWHGTVDPDYTLVRAPTNTAWILGRIQTNGINDYPHVQMLQTKFLLTPLSGTGSKKKKKHAVSRNKASHQPPVEQVASMDAGTFFATMAQLMAANPAPKEDKTMLKKLATLGIIPGNRGTLSPDLEQAPAQALALLTKAAHDTHHTINGWRIHFKDIGTYGTNYLARATIALIGIGANLPEDAVYASGQIDEKKERLHGSNNYLLHFTKEQIPPVNAFWSVTMYNDQQFFVPNPLNRYALGDRDSLDFNDDGSLVIYIQHKKPKDACNWLPAPADAFNLIMRLYWPKESVLNGTWKPAPIKKVNEKKK